MNSSRREFFRTLAITLGGAVLFPTLLSSVAQSAEEGGRRPRPGAGENKKDAGGGGAKEIDWPLVQPGVGMAASVHYVHDHKDLKDNALKVERQGVKWENQHCNGCLLYTKVGMKGSEEVGKCQLFANQLVKGKGFCASWAKKG